MQGWKGTGEKAGEVTKAYVTDNKTFCWILTGRDISE
jgi:hypothetical protein